MSNPEYCLNVQKVDGGYIVEGSFPVQNKFGLNILDEDSFRKIVIKRSQVTAEFKAWLDVIESTTLQVLNEDTPVSHGVAYA